MAAPKPSALFASAVLRPATLSKPGAIRSHNPAAAAALAAAKADAVSGSAAPVLRGASNPFAKRLGGVGGTSGAASPFGGDAAVRGAGAAGGSGLGRGGFRSSGAGDVDSSDEEEADEAVAGVGGLLAGLHEAEEEAASRPGARGGAIAWDFSGLANRVVGEARKIDDEAARVLAAAEASADALAEMRAKQRRADKHGGGLMARRQRKKLQAGARRGREVADRHAARVLKRNADRRRKRRAKFN